MATTRTMFEAHGKAGKMWNAELRRGGPRCDACGADCGSFEALLNHLRKTERLVPRHAGEKATIDAQAERVGEVVAALSPRRKAA
jgi:hypothetical protein